MDCNGIRNFSGARSFPPPGFPQIIGAGLVLEDLEDIFQYEVLKMLKKEGKITDAIIENMLSWRHSGFNIYIGNRIYFDDKASLGNLARYFIRACFSQERMVYIPAEASDDNTAKVVYTSKDRKPRKTFNALDWLARLITHIPGRYEQTVRYYGYYSNKSHGMSKKAETDDDIPAVIPNEMSFKESRQSWARLIQKIYEVDPLICPKCWGQMHIISFIEELDIIEKILRHINWHLDIRNHDPLQLVTSDSIPDLVYDFSDSQIPAAEYWN